jgi:hypothetical protein
MGMTVAGRVSVGLTVVLWTLLSALPSTPAETTPRGTLHRRFLRVDVEECHEAITQYRSALDDVTTNLRAYAQCVSDSRGKDDCSVEFSGLQSAQDDFESAVSSYQSDCD